jgi:hypothetical protein
VLPADQSAIQITQNKSSMDPVFGAIAEQVVEKTAEAQTNIESNKKYKILLKELVDAGINKGLFSSLHTRQSIKDLDKAEALRDVNGNTESDQSFSLRLQEAEFRKVGLK